MKRKPKDKHEVQAAKYTHSVWRGKKYDKPQTVKSLTEESMRILLAHPTIGPLLKGK